MRDTVARLVDALDEFDDDSPIFVNICGHLHRIAYVEGQVGHTEILLLDESNTPAKCATVDRKPVEDSVGR